MNYILVMTLSGSCMFFLYLFQKHTIGRYLPKRWQYLFLKAVMLYYLIPLPYLAVLYRKIIKALFPTPFTGFRYFHDGKLLYRAENYFGISDGYQRRLAAAGLWCLATGIIFAAQFIRYRKTSREILKHGNTEIPAEDTDTLKIQKKRLHVRKNVLLCLCNEKNITFTMGIRKPVIVCSLPENPQEKEMLLGHELMHVKRSDTFWKMAESIVLGIHWFNPVAYHFRREFDFVCETSCDELTLEGYSDENRLQYASMLVERSVRKDADRVWGTALSKNGTKLYERIEWIMKCGKEKKQLNGILSALLVCALVLLNSITVLAYEEVSVVPAVFVEDMKSIRMSDVEFTPTGEIDSFTDIVLYDEQFVDENGNIYPVNEKAHTYANCNHTYISGTYKQHNKNSDGSCTMTYYESQYCTKCGNCIIGKQISQATFTQCVH